MYDIDEGTMQTVRKLCSLRRKVRAGHYDLDRIGDKELLILHRLEFLKRQYRDGKLSEFPPSHFEAIITELRG